jgi:hypothetical protein
VLALRLRRGWKSVPVGSAKCAPGLALYDLEMDRKHNWEPSWIDPEESPFLLLMTVIMAGCICALVVWLSTTISKPERQSNAVVERQSPSAACRKMAD